MIRSILLLLVLLLASCTMNYSYDPSDRSVRERPPAGASQSPRADKSGEPASADAPFPYLIASGSFENGLKAYVVPMPSGGLVSYWTIVRTGSRDEVEKGVTGFAHFFEHMMFHGSQRYPKDLYDKVVNGIGANANAFTTDDFTAYHLSFAKEDLEKVADIEADRFQHLQYDEPDFKTEAGAVYGEYRKGRTNPFEVLYETLQDAAFDRHTYKHTTIGFEADIQKMPEQFPYSKTFFQRFYRPENVVILVVGEVEPKATLQLIYEKYKGWAKGYEAPKVEAEPPQTARRRTTVAFDGTTLPILAVGFKGDAFRPTDRTMVAGLLVSDLCFGETSPLYKKLVLEEQILDSLETDIGPKRDPGLWTVFATVKDKKDLPRVEREIGRALDELRQRSVTAERLDEARSRWKYQFLSGLSTPDHVAESLAPYVAVTGGMDWVFQMLLGMDQLTPADVKRAVSQYFSPERATVVVLHSKGDEIPKEKAAAGSLVAMPVPRDPNVAFKVWFRAGSQDDPPGKEGLADLSAALLAEGGTAKRTYDEILARLFPLAASYSASVDKEMTVFTGVVHRDNASTFFELLSEAILAPGFRAEDFERLRDRAVNEIEKTLRYSSDEELGKETLYSAVYAGTPYGHPVRGTVASLKSITLEDVKAFCGKHYTKDSMTIGLGGAYQESMPAFVAAELGRLPSGSAEAPPRPDPKIRDGRHVTIVKKKGGSAAISLGHPIDVVRGSRDFYALSIARSWLGEHRNSFSHLYQVIRETRGLNYGDYAYIEAFPHGGQRTMPPTGVGRRSQLFEVWIRPVEERNALFALRAALREVERLAKDGMTKEEFESARSFLKNYCLHFAETTAARLGYALDDRFYGIDGYLAQFRKQVGEVTLEEVNAALRKHLHPELLEIAIVAENAEAIRDAISQDSPSPVRYPAGAKLPADVLAEDKVIERHPLRVKADAITILPVEKMFESGKMAP